MKKRTLTITLVALMTIANIILINYLESKSKTAHGREWKSKIKVPRHG